MECQPMKKILLLYLLVLLCAVGISHASIADDLNLVTVLYYDQETIDGQDIEDLAGSIDADKLNSPEGNHTGIIGTAFYYDGVNQATRAEAAVTTIHGMTYSFWIKPNASQPNAAPIIFEYDANKEFYIGFNAADQLEVHTGDGANWDAGTPCQYAVDIIDGNWRHVIVELAANLNNINITVNGATVQNCTNAVGTPAGGQQFRFATRFSDPVSGSEYQGIIDEIAVLNRTLTGPEKEWLYNGGSPTTNQQYPFSASSAVTNFTITATDEWNSTTITWFNATVDGVNYGSNSTGVIEVNLLTNSTTTHNVTLWGATGYFNRTYTELNISTALAGELHQAELCFNATTIIGTPAIMNNYTINGITRTCFNLSSGSYNAQAQGNALYNKNQTFSVNAGDNKTDTFTNMYHTIANVSAYYSNGTIIRDFSINLTAPGTDWTLNGTTTNGSYYFNAVNDSYTALINYTGESYNFDISTIHNATNISLYTFDLDNCTDYGQTVLNFTILDEATDTLVNNATLNIYFAVSSDFFTGIKEYNLSYQDGNYYSVCVPSGTILNFTAYAQAEYSKDPPYDEKNYYLVNFPLSSTEQKINLYLTNGTTQVKLQLRDYNDDAISNAYIRVLSYDVGTDSYKTTEIVNTDSEGDAYAQIILNTAWYAFLVEYNGEVILQTLPTKITSDTLTLRANLDADYFASYDVVQGITHDLTYNNATTAFSFTFSDPTGSVAQGCIQLKRRSINGEVILNTSCETSTAATILMSIPGAVGTYTYEANTYVVIDGSNFALDSLSVSFSETYKTFGLSGVFLSMLLILTLVLVGVWHPVAAIVLMVVGVITTNVMGIFYLNWTYIVTFIILAVITIYRTGKSD